jgi:hypothetical protein
VDVGTDARTGCGSVANQISALGVVCRSDFICVASRSEHDMLVHGAGCVDQAIVIEAEKLSLQELIGVPPLLLGSLASMEEARAQLKCGDKQVQEIITHADEALVGPDETVTAKTTVPPSGDKHDYLSLAPFFWPNNNTATGLPWIRRDGVVNPLTRGNHTDFERTVRLFDRIESLSTGFYVTRNTIYHNKALSLLNTWFVDPATKMNPNINFGQGVPGAEPGRSFGIIEFIGVTNVLDAVHKLRAAGGMPQDLDDAIVAWFNQYIKWLTDSALGIGEFERQNNHGTLYDVQRSSILLFLGMDEQARPFLEAVKMRRIAKQIMPNGTQPFEITRSGSLRYSILNLSGLLKLAHLGNRVGVDLYSFNTSDGRSIKAAEDFLQPYTENLVDWPF